MTTDRPDHPLQRLAPEVVQYHTPQFALKDDLDHLDHVQRVGAWEAVILYCARILEVLAAEALQVVKLPSSANVYSNLDTLQQFNLIPMTTRHCAHALRQTGNQVRHVRRRIQAEDAELAFLFVERWLDWFFCQFRYGRRLPSLTRDQGRFALNAGDELRDLMAAFDAQDFNPRTLLEQARTGRSRAFLRTPALPAVLAELLLDRKEHDAAREVLEVARAAFPDDLRLRQLMGLYWSRSGNLEEALRCLEALSAQFPDDEETAGITAGVCKRHWLADKNNPHWLAKSQRAYRQGWKNSRKTNAYLGINAATTALWLGRPAESRQLAAEVGELLRTRAAALARHADDPDLVLNYWDHVTWAETELLLGKFPAARNTYREAFARHPEQQANIDVSRGQMGEILRALGLSVDAASFLARRSLPPTTRPIIVGVTGHRTLPSVEPLRGRMREALETIRHGTFQDRGPALVALSLLAEGADRLLAEQVLSPEIGGALHVVLPLELADYYTDFASAASRAEFQALLDQAEEITFPPILPDAKLGRDPRSAAPLESASEQLRTAAYEWGGRHVVDHCDVLVALWNGEPAQGRGGTAEVVAYARQLGRPVVWICTMPPYTITWENRPGSSATPRQG